MNHAPFSRFRALMALSFALCAKSPGLSLLAAVDQHGGYKSRGKGKGGIPASGRTVAMDKRASVKRRNVLRAKAAAR